MGFDEDIIWWCKLYNIEFLLKSPCIHSHIESLVKNEICKGLCLLEKNVIGGDYLGRSLGKIISGIQIGTTSM